MCKVVCVSEYVCVFTFEENIGILPNSLACQIWIVNDVTDCKTCLFYVSGLFILFCFRIGCV